MEIFQFASLIPWIADSNLVIQMENQEDLSWLGEGNGIVWWLRFAWNKLQAIRGGFQKVTHVLNSNSCNTHKNFWYKFEESDRGEKTIKWF